MASDGKKRRLGAFEIVKDLAAKGAQGKLFVGRVVEPSFPGLQIGQLVALKVMPVHSDDVERQFRRLKRRTDALAATKHPGIVRYYGCFSSVGGFSEDIHIVVMELLKGQTLEERLAGNSLGLDADEVLKIIRTCAAALSCAAEHGIVHRDIKPSNIFLCEDGGTKLIDFEIARQDGASRTTTESGALRGTVDYMAPDFHQDFRPEKGFRGDQCSDVFSLTVCLYEMLAGCRPYSAGGTLGEQSMMAYFQRWTRVPGVDVNRALKIEPYKIHALAHVQKVIKRGLSPERTGRYLTYFEFSDALRAVKLREIISPTGRYQLLRCVGKGGFGVVFRARRVSDGMIVAIKCLLRPEYSERFIREAKVLRKFHDDRLVSFVEYFKTVRGATETFFIVMQFLEGMPGFSLRDRINGVKAGGRLPPREIAAAFKRFAEGLQLLHEAGVIHRDIKPANLYMPPGHPEKACVMDLGVAKTEETQTNGSLPGTLDYMPPEMATGTSRGEPAVDIYALGLCLYEALTCKTAYPRLKRGGDGLAEFYKRAKAGDKPDLSGLDGSPMWRKLVTKMTDPDVGRRVKTAKEVVRLIARIPDSELPDVREKDADAADRESTDNYVIPGSRGGALPAGETGESVDSTEVHVDNATAEHDSTEIADGGTAVEEPVPPPSPARTNAEAEEKLSAAIAEVENIVAAQEAARGDAHAGGTAEVGGQTLVLDATAAAQETTSAAATATAADLGGQTLVLDAAGAAQGTTTAAVSATAATKAFDGTAADLGGQTLVLDATAAAQGTTTAAVSATAATKVFDATAAAQETTTAAVSATAATKAFDGTAASVGDRTVATAANSQEPPSRPSRIPLAPRDGAGAVATQGGPGSVPAAAGGPRSRAAETDESKAEPSVIISRPKRSRAPLVIAASLAICAVAGSLIAVQTKADKAGQSFSEYTGLPELRAWLPDFHAMRVRKAEKAFGAEVARIISWLNERKGEIGKSDKLDSYGNDLARADEAIAVAWATAEAEGVTNAATYSAVLAERGYESCTNGFAAAIITRREELAQAARRNAIKNATATFERDAQAALGKLPDVGKIQESSDPESFTNLLIAASADFRAARQTAEKAGVARNVLDMEKEGFERVISEITTAIADRRTKINDATNAFMNEARKAILPLQGMANEIANTTAPESYTNEIANAKAALDAAWENAKKVGVADHVFASMLREFKTLSNGIAEAIANRLEQLRLAAIKDEEEREAEKARLAAIKNAKENFKTAVEGVIAQLHEQENNIATSVEPESFNGKTDDATKAIDAAWAEALKTEGVPNGVYAAVLADCNYETVTNGFVKAITDRRKRLDAVAAENRFKEAVEIAIKPLRGREKEIAGSDNPESFTGVMNNAANELEAAWSKAKRAGVADRVRDDVLRDCNYMKITNGFVAAIAKRRAKLTFDAAENNFVAKSNQIRTTLTNLLAQVSQSANPESLTNDLNEAMAKFDFALNEALGKGVTNAVNTKKETMDKLADQIREAITNRRVKIEALANAKATFEEKGDEALESLRKLTGPMGFIVSSDNPDMYMAKIGEAKERLDVAWKTAGEVGVEDKVRKAKYNEFSTCSNNVMSAISARTKVLEGEYGAYEKVYGECEGKARKIKDADSYGNVLTEIADARKALRSYSASSPWKKKYDGLREKYDNLKASISAPKAKIEVKNEGDVDLAVTLGTGKSVQIAAHGAHTFDRLNVWTNYNVSAKVALPGGAGGSPAAAAATSAALPGGAGGSPAAFDYTLAPAESTAATMGPNTTVAVSFAASYKGDPTLVVRNGNEVAIKANGIEIGPNGSHPITGKPRTELMLNYVCDNADWEFASADKPASVAFGDAGAKKEIAAPMLVRKPRIKVTMEKDWAKKHPHVDWVVTLDSAPTREYRIGADITVPANAKLMIIKPQFSETFTNDYGNAYWHPDNGGLKIEYGEQAYDIRDDKHGRYVGDTKLVRGEIQSLAFEPKATQALLDYNINWLKDQAHDALKYGIRENLEAKGAVGNMWPSTVSQFVEPLLMLKEVYNEGVTSNNQNLLRNIYKYESKWTTHREEVTSGWSKMRGHLERLGVKPDKQSQ